MDVLFMLFKSDKIASANNTSYPIAKNLNMKKKINSRHKFYFNVEYSYTIFCSLVKYDLSSSYEGLGFII